MGFIVILVDIVSQVIFWLVLASILLSFMMDPYHPVRRGVDNLVDPMLAPIRKIIPPMGMFDFSPMVLLLVVQVLAGFIKNIFR